MKKLRVLLLLIITLTGCSSVAKKDNIYNLLSAPKLTRRESRVVAALDEYLGENITLKYQKQGNSISPVQLYDINSDNIDEAVVFYNNPSVGGYVQIAIMSQSAGKWQVDYNSEGNGSEVTSVSFTRILKNKPVQIVVEYALQDLNEKILSVYYTDKGQVVDMDIYTCQSYAVGDVTGDNISDIVTVGQSEADENMVLQVISSHSMQNADTISQYPLLSPNIRVTNISISKSDMGTIPAIVIDYSDINQFVHTEIFCLRKTGDIYDVVQLLDSDVVVKKWNFGYNIKSMDVDGDGFVETPTIIDYDLCLAKEIKVMEWTNFVSDEPHRKYFGICVGSNGVYIPLPDEWQDHIKISREEKGVWICANSTDDSDVFTFEFVAMRNTNDEDNKNIRYVNIGTLLAKFTFSEDVSEEQKIYITDNIFSIK